MKELLNIELINNEIIEVEVNYFWDEALYRELEDKNNFIKIENHIIAKKEIRKITHKKIESEEK